MKISFKYKKTKVIDESGATIKVLYTPLITDFEGSIRELHQLVKQYALLEEIK